MTFVCSQQGNIRPETSRSNEHILYPDVLILAYQLGVQIRSALGDLAIEWRLSDDHVLMTGPVEFEFTGRFDAALFEKAPAP